MITGEDIPIKIELNFLENVFHECIETTINTIVPQDLFLKSIGYNLLNIKLRTYPLDEIIIEKYRAVLTRDALKERDYSMARAKMKASYNMLEKAKELLDY